MQGTHSSCPCPDSPARTRRSTESRVVARGQPRRCGRRIRIRAPASPCERCPTPAFQAQLFGSGPRNRVSGQQRALPLGRNRSSGYCCDHGRKEQEGRKANRPHDVRAAVPAPPTQSTSSVSVFSHSRRSGSTSHGGLNGSWRLAPREPTHSLGATFGPHGREKGGAGRKDPCLTVAQATRISGFCHTRAGDSPVQSFRAPRCPGRSHGPVGKAGRRGRRMCHKWWCGLVSQN